MPSLHRNTLLTVTNASTAGDLSNDTALMNEHNAPNDSISDISWSPLSNHLAVASWDGNVRIYETTVKGSGEGKALFQFGGPVLSCHWSKDGKKVVGAGVDKTARIIDLGASGSPAQQVALHEAPIKSVRFFEAPFTNATMIATGSWDNTVKYWDLRQSKPAGSLDCKERVYSMDVKQKLLIAATADRFVHLIDLKNPTAILRTCDTNLKHQIRVVTISHDATSFATCGIEGRCYHTKVDESKKSQSFGFKCHRDTRGSKTDVYAVNAASFHPTHGTLTTAGSDGSYISWNLDAKTKLRHYSNVGGSITATDFNHDGTIYAYAIGYDWSKGHKENKPEYPNKVMLHPVFNYDCMGPTKR